MSREDDWLTAEDVRFDRLVDGELDDEQYRALLASLDDEPGRRRCALAFLEAQLWARDLKGVREDLETETRRTVVPAGGRTVHRRILPLVLTAAASFLLALGMSWAVRLPWEVDQAVPVVVNQRPAEPPHGQLVQDAQTTPAHLDASENAEPPRGQPWGNLTLAVDAEDGRTDEIHVPVFEARDDIAKWILENGSPVPPDIESAWRRIGYEVRWSRQWAPIRVEGHRPVKLSFDQVEIVPVSGRSFQ